MGAPARLLAALVAIAPLLSGSAPAPPGDDLVLEGGRVVDGTGAPAFAADVAVRGGRIAAVGPLPEARKAAARRRIDARGLVVAPGFIDLLGQSEYNVLVDPRAVSKVTQGITTEVTGEGSSIAPLNERLVADGEDVWRRWGVRPDWTTLAGYFARFAATGAPSSEDGPQWPTYDPDADEYLALDSATSVASTPAAKCEFWDGEDYLKSELFAE